MAITHDTTVYACDWDGCDKEAFMPSSVRVGPDNWVWLSLSMDSNGNGEAILCPHHGHAVVNNLDPEVWN